jgi:hypothetical protein
MKKNIISMLLLAALTLGVGGCSDYDSEPEPNPDPEAPSIQTGSDERPTAWNQPDYSRYGLTMSVQVELGDTLARYQSSRDLMCATIGGEVRAVTAPMETGGVIYYPLSIAGDGEDLVVSLHYYCDRLHRIYTINNWAQFNAAVAPTGSSGIYRPCFIIHNA